MAPNYAVGRVWSPEYAPHILQFKDKTLTSFMQQPERFAWQVQTVRIWGSVLITVDFALGIGNQE